MPIASAVGVGTSLLGGFLGSAAAKNAAAAQEAAGQKAVGEVNNRTNAGLSALGNVYQQNQQNLQPYQQAGTQALGQLGGSVLPGGMPNADQLMAQDPGYQFRLQQGQQALERAQAAGGSIGSGGALKAAMQYGQGFASNEYGNTFNRYLQSNQQRNSQLMGLAGLGQNANSQFLSAGNQYGSGTAGLNMDAANSPVSPSRSHPISSPVRSTPARARSARRPPGSAAVTFRSSSARGPTSSRRRWASRRR